MKIIILILSILIIPLNNTYSASDYLSDSFEINNSNNISNPTQPNNSWWSSWWWSSSTYIEIKQPDIVSITEIIQENNLEHNLEEIELNSAKEPEKNTNTNSNSNNINKTTELNQSWINNNFWNIWATYVDSELLDWKISIDEVAENSKFLPKTWTNLNILLIFLISLTTLFFTYKLIKKTPKL